MYLSGWPCLCFSHVMASSLAVPSEALGLALSPVFFFSSPPFSSSLLLLLSSSLLELSLLLQAPSFLGVWNSSIDSVLTVVHFGKA
jgi:hypothetical protein